MVAREWREMQTEGRPSWNIVSHTILHRQFLVLAGIIVITSVLYVPNTDIAFNNWDMDAYRKVLYAGQPLDMAWHLLTDFNGNIVTGYYAPLSSISLMLDKFLVGVQLPQPKVTALVNLLVHILNGVLLFYLLRAVGGNIRVCAMATLIFLIHPIQVAPVMWFAQRKTVTAATFYLMSYLLYLAFRESESPVQYGLSVLSFFLGLLCKPTVAVLPLALAATEVFLPKTSGNLCAGAPNSERQCSKSIDAAQELCISQTSLKQLGFSYFACRVAKRLTPYVFLVIGFSWLFLHTEPTGDMPLPWLDRPFIAAAAIWFYARMVLVPIGLAVIYPRWEVDPTSLAWWIPLIGLALVVVLVTVCRRRLGGHALWGMANFVIPLATSIGFVAFGYFQHAFVADHFLYLSMAAASFLISIALDRYFKYATGPTFYAGVVLLVAYFAFLGHQTYFQTHVWKNSMTLWKDTIEHNPACWVAYNNLGNAMLEKGDLIAAEGNLRRAVELHPNRGETHVLLGLVSAKKGDLHEAIEEYKKALAIKPDLAVAHANLAAAWLQMGHLQEAEKHCRQALELNPDSGTAYVNLGLLKKRSGNLVEAISFYRKALEAEPYLAEAHHNLAVALDIEEKHGEALAHHRQAAALSPNVLEITSSLADSLFKSGRYLEAISFYEKALELRGKAANIHNCLGVAYAMLGDKNSAISHFQASLHFEPNNPDARANLEHILEERGQSRGPDR
jgi:tetratricopeptide (TPR) repeat protein